MKKFSRKQIAGEQGLTLVELLVYIAIVGIVMAGIYTTFKSQQDSYMVQEQLAILQQNLRGAMTLLSSDIQEAGYYTSYDPREFTFPFGTMRPVLSGDSNSINIVKASETDWAYFESNAEYAEEGKNQIFTAFGLVTNEYYVLVKADLSRAEVFQVTGPGVVSLPVEPPTETCDSPLTECFVEPYSTGPTDQQKDRIHRVEIIQYSLDADNNLLRSGEIVAENITSLQFSYAVANSVQVTLTGAVTMQGTTRTRSLTSTIKVRNMGMDTL